MTKPRLCLISAPTISASTIPAELASGLSSDVESMAAYPPLGLLSVAAVAEKAGFDVCLLHIDHILLEAKRREDARDIKDIILDLVAAFIPDLVGFGTICSSYPQTIKIAEGIRQLLPNAAIMFGGPQATVTDVQTLEAFSHVDVIVRGECDSSIGHVLQCLIDGSDLSTCSGITYRKSGAIVIAEKAPLIEDLDTLAFPSYHLMPCRPSTFAIEAGRGCPYACEFCSTSIFFSRTYRMKSPERIYSEMVELNLAYGASRFDLVHDMLTVDRRKVVDLCNFLIERNSPFIWGASARTDRVDFELLRLMKRAGCRALFFGIETGSQRLQPLIKKNIDLRIAEQRIMECDSLGINATTSLIMGYPEEQHEDLEQTLGFFVRMLAVPTVDPQLHVLSPLQGTAIAERYRADISLDGTSSEFAFNGNRPDWDESLLISKFPDIFLSYFSLPTITPRSELLALRDFMIAVRSELRFLVYFAQSNGVGVYHLFKGWKQDHGDFDILANRSEFSVALASMIVTLGCVEADNVALRMAQIYLQAVKARLYEDKPNSRLSVSANHVVKNETSGDETRFRIFERAALFDLPFSFESGISYLSGNVNSVDECHTTVCVKQEGSGRIDFVDLSSDSRVLIHSLFQQYDPSHKVESVFDFSTISSKSPELLKSAIGINCLIRDKILTLV